MAKNPEVDAWLAKYDNPMKPVVERIRETILGADRRVEECIKWQSPTFTFAGNLASFNPRSKQHASLMFHTGAEIPGDYPRLEGSGNTARFMKLASVAEVDAAKAEIERIVAAWIALKGAAGAPGTKAPAKRSVGGKAKNKKKASAKPAVRSPAAAKKHGAGTKASVAKRKK